jgi:hypothetical protein
MIQGFRKEGPMTPDQFWLTDAQFSKIAPHLPTDTRGKLQRESNNGSGSKKKKRDRGKPIPESDRGGKRSRIVAAARRPSK